MIMKFRSKGMGAIAFAASTIVAFCVTGAGVQAQSSNSPVAFVYISNSTSQNSYQINAYAAAANGTLTLVPGSPFAENGFNLAGNRKFLFSSDTVDIYSFAIAPNGALTSASTINAQQYNGYNDGGPVSLFLDRTGTYLYDLDIYGNNGANNTYQSFKINEGIGALDFLGATASASAEWITPLTFIADNTYAYGSSCYHGFQNIYGFTRSSNGSLTDMNLSPAIPAAQTGGYCPYLAAADQVNDIAVSLTPTKDGLTVIGPSQLGVYTADNSGNLTTASTYQNMPQVAVGSINDMRASASGRLLAVAGTSGLQVFHFNGVNPITAYTGLLTADPIDQIFWDNHHHLYGVSRSAGKLYVFNASLMSITQAPGSPYAITSPQYFTVVPES
jgi:hypothetical protein